MKVYISGAITGKPFESVVDQFRKAENEIRERGNDPVNPLNNGLGGESSWLDHMRADIAMLVSCDAIYLMDGWADSRGAIIEYNLSRDLGIKVFLQRP